MQFFDKEAMKKLSFPDSDVESMQFSRRKKVWKFLWKAGGLQQIQGIR